MVHEVEKFFGCYLLVCANPKFKGHTYVGFTVDPNNRIRQHNAGRHAGGAWRTSGRGPWDMVLSIHGFPNMVSALQFEWAWQHPETSLKLKHVAEKHKKLKGFKYKFAIVSEMLRIGPWCRLPLTIRWLVQDFATDFDINLQPPSHMPIMYGPVVALKKKKKKLELGEGCCDSQLRDYCVICMKPIEDNKLECLADSCSATAHMTCLASHFLKDTPTELLPVTGDCPKCNSELLWGDLIKDMTLRG